MSRAVFFPDVLASTWFWQTFDANPLLRKRTHLIPKGCPLDVEIDMYAAQVGKETSVIPCTLLLCGIVYKEPTIRQYDMCVRSKQPSGSASHCG